MDARTFDSSKPVSIDSDDVIQLHDGLFIYKAHLPAMHYAVNEGLPLSTEIPTDYTSYMSKAGMVVFDIATRLSLQILAMQTPHHHNRPTNYSTVLLQQKIQMQMREEDAFKSGILSPRQKHVFASKGDITFGHVDNADKDHSNVWLVSFQPPDGIKQNGPDLTQTLICFSKEDAEKLTHSITVLLAMTSSDLFATRPTSVPRPEGFESSIAKDTLYEIQQKQLHRQKNEIIDYLARNTALRDTIMKLVYPLMPLNDLRDDFAQFVALMKKIALIESVNPSRNEEFYRMVTSFLKTECDVYRRYMEHVRDPAALPGEIRLFESGRATLLSNVNEYTSAVLKPYIEDKKNKILEVCREQEIPASASYRILNQFMRQLNSVEFATLYRTIPKKSDLFEINPVSFKEAIDKQLDIANIETYVARQRSSTEPRRSPRVV